MVAVRVADWPADADGIAAVDTSLTTDRVYRVESDGMSFRLRVETVAPPFAKTYDVGALTASDRLYVAEDGGRIVGFAEIVLESWNRRATITHLYVDPEHRGRGVGRALVDAIDRRARADGVRCLWLETQNVNYPAVQFYRRLGFRLCGLDETLYDPAELPREVALFFARELGS